MGNAGRVLMIPKGEYNSATTYEMLDFVYYQGRSYVCKQTSTGNAPTNTTYWQALTGDASAEIQALTNYVTDTGVKNLLPYPYYNTSKTASGITFTDNGDGGITLNGTATGAVDFVLFNGTALKGFSGAILNGNPLPASQAIIQVEQYGGSWTNYGTAAGGADTTLATIPDNTTVWIFLRIFAGVTLNNAVVYPMIRDASIADATYQPYAKTNVELTQDVAGLTTKSFTKITDSEYANEILFAKSGTSKIVQVSAPKGIAANANVEIAIPSGYTSEVAIPTGSLASFTSDFVISGGKIRMSINNAGNLVLRSSIAITSAIDEILYMPYV